MREYNPSHNFHTLSTAGATGSTSTNQTFGQAYAPPVHTPGTLHYPLSNQISNQPTRSAEVASAMKAGLASGNQKPLNSAVNLAPSAPTTGYQDSALDPVSTTSPAPTKVSATTSAKAAKPSAPTTLDGPATQTSQTIETTSQPANYIVPVSPSTDSLFNPTSTNSNPATTPTPPVTPLPSNPSTGADSPPTRSTTPTDEDESPTHRWLPALLILLLLLGIGWFVKTRIDTRLARQAAEQAALSDRLNSLNDDASFNNLNVANLTSKLATIENLNVTDTATINHLRVTGDSNLNGGVAITGPLTLNGDLVSNSTTTNSSTTNGNSTTTGQGTFGSILVQGDATVQGNTSLNSLSAGATTLNSLIVSGNTSLGGGSSIAQNLSVGGNLSVQGNTTLNTLTASAFFGNGAGLTNLNATNITSGTLQDARLSSNVALLDRANQTFIGNNTFGSNLSVQGTTSLQALNVASGLTVSSASPIVATFNGRVVGTDAINTNEFVTLGQLTTISLGNAFIQNGNSFGTTAILGTNDAFDLALETGGTTKLTIQNSTGNVGIGTTNPQTRLAISSVDPSIGLVDTSLGGSEYRIRNGVASSGTFDIYDQTAGASRFQIDSFGQIGIGAAPINEARIFVLGNGTNGANVDARSANTLTPATFEVQASDYVTSLRSAYLQYNGFTAPGTLLSGTIARADSAILGFQNASNALIYTTNSAPLILGTNDTERLRITPTGNVGIGTTTPGYKLDVSGGTGIVAQFSGRVIGGNAINSNEFTTKAQLDAVTSGTAGAFIQNGNSFGATAILGTNDANDLQFETGGTTKLTIQNSTGNVGIGTIIMNQQLNVANSIALNTQGSAYSFYNGGTINSWMAVVNAANSGLTGSAQGDLILRQNLNNAILFGTNGDNVRMAIAAGGNVGIGTTTPGSTLHVVGATGAIIDGSTGGDTAAALSIRRSDVTSRSIQFFPSYNDGSGIVNRVLFNGGLKASFNGAASYNFDGDVGIGTTTPGSRLDVYNNTAASNVNLFRLLSDVGGVANVKFRVDSDGDIFTDGSVTIGTPADIAEHYSNSDNAQPGDVVVFTNTTSVSKSSTPNQKALAGVVSTNPGLTLSGDTQGVPVALSGRVPVKVSVANGPIEIGDYLTSGPNGTALKATQAGPTIGTALTATSTNTTIEVFVHLGHYTPTQTQVLQAGTGSALTQTQGSAGAFTSLNVSGATTLTSLTVTGAATFQSNLTVAGTLTTQDIVVRGHIKVGQDTGGTVTIPAGQTEATVTFTTPYTQIPKVTATADGFVIVKVDGKTLNGFKVRIQNPQSTPTTIDWIALE